MGEIDEYRTTKICNDCNEILQQVRDSKYKEVRGLSRCCSTECSQISFKNRDLNAALNITRCYLHRPTILSRDLKEKLQRPKAFVMTVDVGRDKDCRTDPVKQL